MKLKGQNIRVNYLQEGGDEEIEDFKRVEPYDTNSFDAEGGDSDFSSDQVRPEVRRVLDQPQPTNRLNRNEQKDIKCDSSDWQFLQSQFLLSKQLKIDKEDFLDSETGIGYLLNEMDKQAGEEPIIKQNKLVHNQEHLHGWMSNGTPIETLAQWREEMKQYEVCLMNEILQRHFENYLSKNLFKLHINAPINTCAVKKDIHYLISTTMETIRLNGKYFIIISGHRPGTRQQGIQIHKYLPDSQQVEMIHEIQLNRKPLEANPVCAKTWIQNGGFIYYFELQNQEQRETIVYTLFKFDLAKQKEIWVKQFETQMPIVIRHSGERDAQLAAGVLFSHSNIQDTELNNNEFIQIDEDEFFDSQFICIATEYFVESKGYRVMYQLRTLKDFTFLAQDDSNEPFSSVQAVFLHLTQSEHQSLNISQDIIVVSENGDHNIFKNQRKGEINKLEQVTPNNTQDYKQLIKKIDEAIKRISTSQYFYYHNSEEKKDSKEYLKKIYHQLPKYENGGDRILSDKMQDLYERQLNVAHQRTNIKTLMQTFIPSEISDYQNQKGSSANETLSCLNANMIYDPKEDHYTIILKTADGNVHIVTGQRDERRFVHRGACSATHPYEVAQNANATGLKQLDKNFGNVFIQQYKERDRDEWLHSVVYINEEGEAISQSSASQFDLALARLKAGYHLYGKLNDNDCWQSKRLELAEDDRFIKPRVNCQFGEGLFIEVYDCQAERAWKRQKVQILFNQSQRQIDANERLYASQQLTQSSNVYRGRYEGEYCQDYQWCFIGASKLWARILEYRVGWTPAHPERSRLLLIGFKLIVFRNVYPALGNHLGPLFNSNYEIDGTQWNLKDFKIQLPRFREQDFQFHRDLASSGYKKYYLKGDLNRVHSVLFETRLSQRIQENAKMFSPVERLSIMEQQVRTMMNMVPHDMQTWRTHLDNISGSSFEFFQPLENLRGQSTADFFTADPDILQKKIKTLRSQQDAKKSIIGEFLEQLTPKNKQALHDDLRLHDFYRQDYECCKDLYGHDTLLKCFDGERVQVTASRILLEHFLTLEKSVSAQRMMMVMIPYVLESDDDYDGMADFFVALKGGNAEVENKSMSYAQHLKVFELPHFSDEEFHMEQFTLDELNRTNLSTFITNNILTRFSAKDHQKLQIPVEHFSVEFLSQRLHYKMQRFWAGQELEPYEITEYDLANTLSRIVNKYDYQIEKYTSVRFMVDCQFATTYGFFRFQCILYLCGFFVPMMTQIFLLAGAPWLVRLCNLSCLATSCFFLGLEYLQLQDVGWATYAGNFYNIIDMAMFVTYVTYFLLRMADPGSSLLPLQQGAAALVTGTDAPDILTSLSAKHDAGGAVGSAGDDFPTHGPDGQPLLLAMKTDALAYLYAMALLNSAMVVQAFLKVMFFLRIQEGFGLLVDLVAECLGDAIPFTVFLMMWIGLFTVLFRLQGLEVAADDYDQLGPMAIYSIQTYRNSVGDIAAPAYSFWTAQEAHPALKYSMIAIIWSTWLLNQFFLTIILLNFLIAILAESFSAVMACATQHKYKQRVAMNNETFLTLKAFGMLQPFEGFVLTANCSKGRQEEDPVADAVDAVAETQQEILGELSELKSQLGDVLSKLGEEAAGGGAAAVAEQVKAELLQAIKELMPAAGQAEPASGAPNEALEAVSVELAEVKAQGTVLQEDLQAVRGEMSELKGLMERVLSAMPSQMPAEEEQKVAGEANLPGEGSQGSGVADPQAEGADPTAVIARLRGHARTTRSPGANVLLNLKEAYEEE